MTAILEITPEERVPLAFVLAVEIGHLQHGTREHRDTAAGLRELYNSLYDAPVGPVQLELSNDELYMLGIRIYADASELEEWWLDHRASMRAIQEPALFPDENFGRAVQRFFPDLVDRPDEVDFEDVRPLFGGLARKLDLAMIEYDPAARALYNKERTEINERVRRMQRDRAERRERRYPRISRGIWRGVLRADELAFGDMTDVEIEGRHILVAHTGDGFYAIDAVCTHVPQLAMFANLAKGELDTQRGCVTCPWHGSQFELRTGRVVRQPYAPEFKREHFFTGRVTAILDPKKTATDTRVYPTKVEANMVYVDIG